MHGCASKDSYSRDMLMKCMFMPYEAFSPFFFHDVMIKNVMNLLLYTRKS